MTVPDEGLLQKARAAASSAYAKYSNFRVGAAVRAGGAVYSGHNIENASSDLTICAERVAVFAAISAGARRIDAMALACIDATPGDASDGLMPCGACLQVMAEFASPDLPVHVDRVRTFTLAELLPHPFKLRRA